MRCDRCGARNAVGASWCTQCYASFTPATPEAAPEAPPQAAPEAPQKVAGHPPPQAPSGNDVAHPPPDPAAGRSPAGPVAGTDEAADPADATGDPTPTVVEVGDVRDHDGVVEWRCHTCGSWVALDMPNCSTCGSPRAGFGEETRPEAAVVASDHRKVLTASALFAGVGHLIIGRTGSGVTRLILGVLWLIGGIWWIATTAASGSAPGLVLLVGALVLWVASYLDVQAILSGRDEPFGVRGLLWSVVGVTALLMVSVAWLATGPSLG